MPVWNNVQVGVLGQSAEMKLTDRLSDRLTIIHIDGLSAYHPLVSLKCSSFSFYL